MTCAMSMTDEQLRLDALDRALTYHQHRNDSPDPDDVTRTASRFYRFLQGEPMEPIDVVDAAH